MLARLWANPVRLKYVVAALTAFIWLIVYLTTVSPTVNFIDSGELIAAANEPGIAHAPGYPLYVLMGYVAIHLLGGDVAWRMNVLSALWGALAVGTCCLLLLETSEYVLNAARSKNRRKTSRAVSQAGRQYKRNTGGRKGTDRAARGKVPPPVAAPPPDPAVAVVRAVRTNTILLVAAVAGASLLASSSSFWSRTAQAKMYSLHFFFVFLLFLLALRCRRAYDAVDKQGTKRWLIALAATLGLSFTNHLTTLLLVVPLLVLLLGGEDFAGRFRSYYRQWKVVLPAFLVPLLLYLYMPLRSAQGPIMNWGSPNSWGDFWRQISGWQFRPFLLGDLGGNLQRNTTLISGYGWGQWAEITVVVFLCGLAAAALLARANKVLFAATTLYALLTLFFSLFYGISEIEPYMVPFYSMFAVWIGLAPAAWLAIAGDTNVRERRDAGTLDFRPLWAGAIVMTLLALAGAALVYPRQNYSNNRLAEQFATNVFNQLPPNSILITDYWDFYSPTYYLQMIKGVRPDLVLVDKSLLRYPFFTQQLQKRYPWLIQKSQDIVSTFATEQRKWVNGEPFDSTVLNKAYFDLMTSFVERNQADHSAFLLTLESCVPNVVQSCESNQIAPTWFRKQEGLVTQLLPSKPPPSDLPQEPSYKLEGIVTNGVSMDDTAKTNSSLYVDAYRQLAAVFGAANQGDKATRMAQLASEVQAAIATR